MPESENRCFLGIADLFYNLMITLREAGLKIDKLSYHDCHEYGNILEKYGKEQNYNVYLSLSRDKTCAFYNDNRKYVEEDTWDNVKGIKLKGEFSNNELIDICRCYLPLNMLLIILDYKVMSETIRYYQKEHGIKDDAITNPLFKVTPIVDTGTTRTRIEEHN